MDATQSLEKILALHHHLACLNREYKEDAALVGGESDSPTLRQTLVRHRDYFQDVDSRAESVLKGVLSNGVAPDGRRWGEIKQLYAELKADYVIICREAWRREASMPLATEDHSMISKFGRSALLRSASIANSSVSQEVVEEQMDLEKKQQDGESGLQQPAHCQYYCNTAGGPLLATVSCSARSSTTTTTHPLLSAATSYGCLGEAASMSRSASPMFTHVNKQHIDTTAVMGNSNSSSYYVRGSSASALSASPSYVPVMSVSDLEFIGRYSAGENFVEKKAPEKERSGCFSFFNKSKKNKSK